MFVSLVGFWTSLTVCPVTSLKIDRHLFSLNDLTAVRNGELASRMKELLKLGTKHVADCVVR